MPGRRAYTTPVQLDELFEHAVPFPFPQGEDHGVASHPGEPEHKADPCHLTEEPPLIPPWQGGKHLNTYGTDSCRPATQGKEHPAPEAIQPAQEEQLGSAGKGPRPGAGNPLPSAGGVYLLTDEEDRIIQLASAGNLRRSLHVRLFGPPVTEGQPQAIPSRRRADLKQIVRKIRWREAHSAFEIGYEYWRLARVLMPDTYLKQLAFAPAWFVHVDREAEIPRFVAGKVLRSPPGVDLGPFFTNADATRFIQVLEDGFDLCRYYHILEQAPHGTACAYFDMGKCPAPCDGSIPMSQYRRMIGEALAFAGGGREAVCQHIEVSMREAADQQEYEHAGRLKQRLDRLREIEHRSFALARPIEQFNYLIVQRGGGRTRVRPFFVRAGTITPGETAALKHLETAAEQWGEKGTGTGSIPAYRDSPEPAPVSVDRQALSEQIWLVTHFLGKKEPPGLFILADDVPDPADLGRLVGEHFAKPDKSAEEEPPADPPHDGPEFNGERSPQ